MNDKTILMKKNLYIVSIGSNIEPQDNTMKVVEILQKEQEIIDQSPFEKTEPVGFKEQPDFLNGAVYIRSRMEPKEFKLYLKEVEKRLKRVKGKNKSGPRTMDLDIILCNGKIIHQDFYTATYIQKPIHYLIQKHSIQIEG